MPDADQFGPVTAAELGKPDTVPSLTQWAVSVVLTQHKPDGKINVQNHLQKLRAASREEAVGRAVENSMKQLPEHQVHCYTAMEFN